MVSPRAKPDKAVFSFEGGSGSKDSATEASAASKVARSFEPAVKLKQPPLPAKEAATQGTAAQAKVKDKKVGVEEIIAHTFDGMSKADLESQYLRKAAELINALPDNKASKTSTIKSVSQKLRSSYLPEVKANAENNEILKARYVFAIINYINKVLKKGAKPLTADFLKETLKDNDGSILHLFSALVAEKYVALDDLTEITGLCRTILDVLPKPESAAINPTPEIAQASKDPVDGMTAWPAREKRENGMYFCRATRSLTFRILTLPAASHRTCTLKGVSSITSINQLQSLVWGGRLESLSLPDRGADFALVKFLTPEACEKYFSATENGIELPGDKKTVIFVEKTAGPNSINDVIRNCIDGDASRCVRAVGADDALSDAALMKFARGADKVKREMDTIKRGKNARGVSYPIPPMRYYSQGCMTLT